MQEMKLDQIAPHLFDGFVEGGNGEKDGKPNYKAPYLNQRPKDWDKMQRNGCKWICGLIPQWLTVVDYDEPAAFEARLKISISLKECCVAVRSPNKGGHFWWNAPQEPPKSNSGNKNVLTLFPVDYKSGIRKVESTGELKPAKCAESLSCEDGSLREVVYCNFKDDWQLDEVPFYDLPMKTKSKHEFLGMEEGDGRQDALYTYMLPMKAAGYSYEQYREVAELANTVLFKTAMDAEEFEGAVRKEAWDAADGGSDRFFSKGKFLHNVFADYLMEKYHVKKINGYIHSYKEGVYLSGYEAIEKAMLKEIPSLTRTRQNEVLNYIRIQAVDVDSSKPELIPFKNGLFDAGQNRLLQFSPDAIVTNMIPWDYSPAAASDLVDSVLDRLSCGDSEVRKLLEEVAGACLYKSNTLGGGKAFILIGDKRNGKSTFIEMLETMLGEANVSNLDFKELDEKFSTAMLFGKLANLGDDISDSYKEDVAIFKKIVTGEHIKGEEKGKPPFNFKPFSKLVFSANSIPRINDPTGAALRRLLIVPLNAKFSESDSDYDPQIKMKLAQKEAVEYFIQLAIKGLQRVLENKRFTLPQKVQQEKESYERENNPIMQFIEECKNDDGEIEGIYNEPTDDVYRRYQEFCIACSFKMMTKQTFCKRMNQALGTAPKNVRLNGKQKKIFVQA